MGSLRGLGLGFGVLRGLGFRVLRGLGFGVGFRAGLRVLGLVKATYCKGFLSLERSLQVFYDSMQGSGFSVTRIMYNQKSRANLCKGLYKSYYKGSMRGAGWFL